MYFTWYYFPGHSRLLSGGRVSGWTYLAILDTRSPGGYQGGWEKGIFWNFWKFLQKFTLRLDFWPWDLIYIFIYIFLPCYLWYKCALRRVRVDRLELPIFSDPAQCSFITIRTCSVWVCQLLLLTDWTSRGWLSICTIDRPSGQSSQGMP